VIDDIRAARDAALARVGAAHTLDEVIRLDAELLGRRGTLGALKARLGSLPLEARKDAGRELNAAHRAVAEALGSRRGGWPPSGST
jgi:hypothetical protein